MNRTHATNCTPVEPGSAQIVTDDGVPLAARIFEPPETARATALITGGVGVPQRMYRQLAEWLSSQGIRCVTFDYRGFGDSRHSLAGRETASLSAWAERDAVAVFEYAERNWTEPVVLLAHSFGGQLLAIADPLRRAAAAVLIASQCGSARYWDGIHRLKMFAIWYAVLPIVARLYKTTPKWLGFRIPHGVAREWARWGRCRDWLFSPFPDAERRLASFPCPLLAYSVADDDLAPPRAVAAFLKRFNPERVKHRKLEPYAFGIDGIGHFGVFEHGLVQPVWNEISAFLTRGSGSAALRLADELA